MNNASVKSPPVARADYTNAMRLAPGAVGIITTEHQGARGGLAATAWASVTADPPTVLACVNQAASAHGMFLASGRFAVNLVPTGEEEVVAIFSRQRGLEGDDRFLSEHWETGPLGLPILKRAVFSLECALVDVRKIGTHSVLFGEVVSVSVHQKNEPLMYAQGGYTRIQHL